MVTAGIPSFSILGHDLGGSVFTVENTSLTLAVVISVVALGVANPITRMNGRFV